MKEQLSRRGFAGLMVAGAATAARAAGNFHLVTNVYPWHTFYRREGRDYTKEFDHVLGEVKQAGIDGFEGIAKEPADVAEAARLLKKHGIEMRSLYVNSTLHEPDKVDDSIASILAIADEARKAGTKMIVTNPNPIQWGGTENKNDEQIRFQAASLERLGRELKKRDITLAYHFHDPELRAAARELHHMMVGTDPELLSLCLDVHWVYRGAENSEVAVFDIANLYAGRIVELHLRQSQDGIWTEAFGPGDIDYPRLAKLLEERGVRPLVTLEQSIEKSSPKTMNGLEAHRKSVAYARKVFANVAG